MQIKEAIDEYHYAILQHSEKTQIWYKARLHAFACWCEDQQLSLEQVKPHVIGKYTEFLQKTPSERTGKLRSSYTVHGHLRTIRTFLNWCSREEDFEEFVFIFLSSAYKTISFMHVFYCFLNKHGIIA